jgi:hypothetical protein
MPNKQRARRIWPPCKVEMNAFESWYQSRFDDWQPEDFDLSSETSHKYVEEKVQQAWLGWQAAKVDVEPVLDSARVVVDEQDGKFDPFFKAVDDLTAKLKAYDKNTKLRGSK